MVILFRPKVDKDTGFSTMGFVELNYNLFEICIISYSNNFYPMNNDTHFLLRISRFLNKVPHPFWSNKLFLIWRSAYKELVHVLFWLCCSIVKSSILQVYRILLQKEAKCGQSDNLKDLHTFIYSFKI